MALLVPTGTKVYEADEDQVVHTAWGNMVISGGAIAAQGAPNMTVVISVGALRYQGAKVTIAAVASLAISASDPTNPRIDTIHVPGANGNAAVVTGTPAAVPQPPSLPVGSILLGYVSVAAAAVNVGNQNITDRRLLLPTGGLLAGDDLANYLSLVGAAAASNPAITALGSDANVGIVLTPKGTGSVRITSGPLLQPQGAAIASAATTDLSTLTGNFAHVTGTTTITGFGTVQAGPVYKLVFDGILTLTHNAASLILRGAANYTTVAGDVFYFASEGAGNWREVGRLTTASIGGSFTTANGIATSNTNLNSAATWIDVTGASVSLAAGTWLISGGADIQSNTTTRYAARITTGSVHYFSAELDIPSASNATIICPPTIVVLGSTTTVKIQAYENSGTNGIVAAAGIGGSGNVNTQITAVKVG